MLMRPLAADPQPEEPKTWCDVMAMAERGPGLPGHVPVQRARRLFYNIHPAILDHSVVHMLQWDRTSTNGEGTSAELQEWLSNLQPGHELWLQVGTDRWGVLNYVGPVRMEVYCACV